MKDPNSQYTHPPITPGRARSFSSSQGKCPVALLDIDKTLSFDLRENDADKFGVTLKDLADLVINPAVLDDLRERNISDVYFFTKMRGFSLETGAGSVPERSCLIKFFRDQGFKFHGIITAQDYTSHIPTEELKNYIEEYGRRYALAQRQEGFNSIQFKKEQPALILNEMAELFPNITRLYFATLDLPNDEKAFIPLKQLWIGDAFKRATEAHTPKERKALLTHSTYAQQVSDMLMCTEGKESKTLMFRQFMRQRAKYLVEIHVYDDLREELDAIENIKHEFHDAKIYTYHVTGLGPEKIIPLSKNPKIKHHSADGREKSLPSLTASAASITLGFPQKPGDKNPRANSQPGPEAPTSAAPKKAGIKKLLFRLGGK